MQWYQTREFTEGIYNLMNVISKHIKMQGFMISSYFHLYSKFPEMTLDQIKQGKLVYICKTCETFKSKFSENGKTVIYWNSP